MKRILTAAALTLAITGAALAQTAPATTAPGASGAAGSAGAKATVGTTAPAGATGSVAATLTAEQQSKVKAFIAKEKVKSVAAPAGFTVAAGATLPASVELRTFPADVGVKQSYAVVGERTVLVEPATRRIVQVIQ
jgi:Protein of unknown function (DUF1236)